MPYGPNRNFVIRAEAKNRSGKLEVGTFIAACRNMLQLPKVRSWLNIIVTTDCPEFKLGNI